MQLRNSSGHGLDLETTLAPEPVAGGLVILASDDYDGDFADLPDTDDSDEEDEDEDDDEDEDEDEDEKDDDKDVDDYFYGDDDGDED